MSLRKGSNSLTHKSGTIRYTLHKKANETLEKEGIQAAVICPDDVDPNEWIAVHTIDFYNDVNLLFGVVQDECTNYSCPIMSAGENYEFLWTDKYKYRKPTRLPAKVYIDYLMNWIVHLIEDVNLFPVEPNIPFPPDYLDRVRNIFRRMFRVYAHIYYSHMNLINQLQLTEQFNFSLCHFLFFVDQFRLVGYSDIRPLRELITQLVPNLRLTKELNEAYERRERGLETSNSVSQNLDVNSTLPSSSTYYLSSTDHSYHNASSPSVKHASTRIIGNPSDGLFEPLHSSSSKPVSTPAHSLNPLSNEEETQPSNQINDYQSIEQVNPESYEYDIKTEVMNELEAAAELAQQDTKVDDSKCACIVV